jgi:hypothetical protein
MHPVLSKPVSPARRLAWLAVSVVVLAVVILGSSMLSDPGDPPEETPSATLAPLDEATLALDRARAALASGDTTAAIAALEEALRLDPDDRDARALLDETRAVVADGASSVEQTSTDVSTGDPGGLTPDDPAFSKATDDLAGLLPAQVSGFVLGATVVTTEDAAVSGTPATGSERSNRVLLTVHDRKTPKAAAAFVDSVSRSLYPEDSEHVVVDGAKGYFGTDGKRFATVVYVRGRYVFEVVATATDFPVALRGEVMRVAKAFPESL